MRKLPTPTDIATMDYGDLRIETGILAAEVARLRTEVEASRAALAYIKHAGPPPHVEPLPAERVALKRGHLALVALKRQQIAAPRGRK